VSRGELRPQLHFRTWLHASFAQVLGQDIVEAQHHGVVSDSPDKLEGDVGVQFEWFEHALAGALDDLVEYDCDFLARKTLVEVPPGNHDRNGAGRFIKEGARCNEFVSDTYLTKTPLNSTLFKAVISQRGG
jgi:hypothetical protein